MVSLSKSSNLITVLNNDLHEAVLFPCLCPLRSADCAGVVSCEHGEHEANKTRKSSAAFM